MNLDEGWFNGSNEDGISEDEQPIGYISDTSLQDPKYYLNSDNGSIKGNGRIKGYHPVDFRFQGRERRLR